MEYLNIKNPYILSWQSAVGPSQWQGPQTNAMIKKIGEMGQYKNIMLIPIAFTSDHIETLREIDIDFAQVAKESGIAGFYRSESLNDDPLIIQAMADIITDHMKSKKLHSSQYPKKCPDCINSSICRPILNPEPGFTI